MGCLNQSFQYDTKVYIIAPNGMCGFKDCRCEMKYKCKINCGQNRADLIQPFNVIRISFVEVVWCIMHQFAVLWLMIWNMSCRCIGACIFMVSTKCQRKYSIYFSWVMSQGFILTAYHMLPSDEIIWMGEALSVHHHVMGQSPASNIMERGHSCVQTQGIQCSGKSKVFVSMRKIRSICQYFFRLRSQEKGCGSLTWPWQTQLIIGKDDS